MTNARDLQTAVRLLVGDDSVVAVGDRKLLRFRRLSSSWLIDRGIQAVGVSLKETDWTTLRRRSVTVYVEKKKPTSKCTNVVPKILNVPGIDGEIETDVVAIGKIRLQTYGLTPPIVPDLSIGHRELGAGTICCVVEREQSPGVEEILTCAHVAGYRRLIEPGEMVYAPAYDDGGRAPNGVVGRTHAPTAIVFGGAVTRNAADAVVVTPSSPERITPMMRKLLGFTGVSMTIRDGMIVHRMGRSTGRTVSVVKGIAVQYWSQFRTTAATLWAGFGGHVMTSASTREGDSGAAVTNENGELIGMHVAAANAGSIFCPIGAILKTLRLRVVTRPMG